MDGIGTVLGEKWPFLLALFCTTSLFMVMWRSYQRRAHIVAQHLSWGATMLGTLIILAFLAALLPERAWAIVVITFGVGGLPAVAAGLWMTFGFMNDAPRVVSGHDEAPTARQ